MNDQKSPPFFPEKGRIFHFPPGRRADFTEGPLDARFKTGQKWIGLIPTGIFLFVAAIPFHSITFVPCPICAPFTLGTKEEQWKNNIARLTHKGGQVYMHELIF